MEPNAVKDINPLVAHESPFLIKFGHIGIQIVKITDGLLDIPMGSNREAKGTTGKAYVPIMLDTKKESSSGTQILKNGMKQRLLSSLIDFENLYSLYEIVVCWRAAR